jgi:hypothetical protein
MIAANCLPGCANSPTWYSAAMSSSTVNVARTQPRALGCTARRTGSGCLTPQLTCVEYSIGANSNTLCPFPTISELMDPQLK